MTILIISLYLFCIMFNVFARIEIKPIKKKGTGIHANSITLYNCMVFSVAVTRDVRRALIKVKILTGVYVLQCNRGKFHQHAVSPTCCLCRVAVGTPHSRKLRARSPVRQNYLKRIDWFRSKYS